MPDLSDAVDDGTTPERARRDLFWLLDHSPLVSDAQEQGVDWLGPSALRQLRAGVSAAVSDIPDHALDLALSERRSGRYFEALIVALLRGSKRFDVLAHDRQVIQEKRTLGAFDVILRDTRSGGHIHLELAFKQYLHRVGDPLLQRHWVGPRGRDRLDLKYAHMVEHQLRLGSTLAGRECLQGLQVGDYRRCALMAGRLFVPWKMFVDEQRPALPEICAAELEWGWWLTIEQWLLLEPSECEPFLLPPKWAIAPLEPVDCARLARADQGRVEAQLQRGVPALVALTRGGYEVSRGWVVLAEHHAATSAP